MDKAHNTLLFYCSYFFVLGHHDRCVIVVILQAAVSSAFKQHPHDVYLTSATGHMQGSVPAVRLSVDVTSILWP